MTTRQVVMARGWRVLLLAPLFVGCAVMQTQGSVDPAGRLRERASQYWDARIKGDLTTAYTTHEPAFRRAISLQTFAPSMGVTRILAYQIGEVRIEGDLGFVRMKMRGVSAFAPSGKQTDLNWQEIEERWVRVEGEWYRRFRFPSKDPYPPVNWNDVTIGLPTITSPSGP